MKRYIITFILILSFSVSALAFENGDFQYWNSESLTWKVNKDWSASLEEEFRFGDNSGTLYYQHSDLGATYSGLAKWLDIGINYRQIFDIKKDNWDIEHRPHLNGTVKFDLYGFGLSNRSRFEYRIIEHKDDELRYRNKSTIKLQKFTQFEIQPYIADEIFIDFDIGELNKNRTYFGFSFKVLKNLKAELFYLFQSDKKKDKDKWTSYNILGTKVKLQF